MIIPIGQQDSTVRRLPWVTFTIMILCVLVFLGTLGPTRRLHRQASLKLAEAATYWMQHPYLKPDKRLKGLLTGGSGQREEAMMELVRQFGKKPPPTAPELKKQQAHLEELVEAAFSLVRKIPAYRWGLVPAHPTATTYITYMFMHGGWLHLLGNLFILFLTGPFLEDAWGRPLYAGVYLISGIFSAFMFAVHYPHFQGPLIGASGAIAGVMGAFLIRFWSRRIRFFYWFFFVFFGTFEAPAWLMLGLWLARELVFAQAKDTLAPGTGGGTAHWAHVWGFGFGLLVAFVVKRFDLEERFIHPAIESKITVVNNEPIERAMEAYKAGDVEQAWRLLEMELRKNPDNLDTQLALWNLAVESGRARDAVRHAKRLIRSSLRSGNEEGAVVVWSELMGNVPGTRLDPSTAVSVARVLADGGRLEEAERALEALTTLPTMEVPAGPLVRGARLAVEHRLPISRLIVARLMENPDVPAEARVELERAVEELPETTQPVGAGEEEQVPAGNDRAVEAAAVSSPIAVEHTLQVREAVPVALDVDSVRLRIEGNERGLRLDHLKAVAAAAVPGTSGKPTVVVDLLLDGPWEDRPVLRTVRLWGASFDPRTVVPGLNPVESLRAMLSHIIDASGATPLPDPDSARGRPFQRFNSLAEYEEEVLGVSRAEEPTA